MAEILDVAETLTLQPQLMIVGHSMQDREWDSLVTRNRQSFYDFEH